MFLYYIRHTETLCYGYDHRQNRNNRENQRVSEALCGIVQVLTGKTTHYQHDRADKSIADTLKETVVFGLCHAPHVIAQKFYNIGELYFHGVYEVVELKANL